MHFFIILNVQIMIITHHAKYIFCCGLFFNLLLYNFYKNINFAKLWYLVLMEFKHTIK
jgi:hypothetical protein